MYIYELHCHTQETSKCGKLPAAEMMEFYHKAGYTGVVVTDHFFNGNTTVTKYGSWEERVGLFRQGYLAAKKRGEELGLDVFFGWEFGHKGTDFLTYGLDIDWLLAHPFCDQLAVRDYSTLVRQSGGYLVQAHPFREAQYIEMIRLLPRGVDAVEVCNGCRDDFTNLQAMHYAEVYGLPKSVGTDNHMGFRSHLTGVELSARAESPAEILRAVVQGDAKLHLWRLHGTAEDFTMEERPLTDKGDAEI